MPSRFANAQIDFSALRDMGESIGKGIERRRFAKDVSAVPRGPNGELDFSAMSRLLLQYDRPDEAASFARLAQGQDDTPSSFREFQLAQSNPEFAQFLGGNKPTEAMQNAEYFGNLSTDDPRLRFAPRAGGGLTTVDKKEIFSSEDEATNLDATIGQLTAASELNDQTFEGYGAGMRGSIGAKLPDMAVPDFVADPQTAKNTLEWQKLMEPEAIKTMASTLKGATTDFELNTFVRLLSDPSTPRDVRKRVITRMLSLAERQRALARERINELRGQTYFAPGGGLSGSGERQTPGRDRSMGPLKYEPDPAKRQVGQVYDFPNGSQALWHGNGWEPLD